MSPTETVEWCDWHDQHAELHEECHAGQGGCEWSSEVDLPCLLDRIEHGPR